MAVIMPFSGETPEAMANAMLEVMQQFQQWYLKENLLLMFLLKHLVLELKIILG